MRHALDMGGFAPAPRTPALLGLDRARGDLWAPNSGGILTRLPVGPNGTLLIPDNTQPTGQKWISPDAALIQSMYFANSTTGTGPYTANLVPTPVAYEDGAQYSFTVSNTNTIDSPTINFNSLGALNILMNGVGPLTSQLSAGVTYQGIRSGSNLLITNQVIVPSSGLITSLRQGTSDSDDFLNDNWTLNANLSKAGYKTAFETSGTGSKITTDVHTAGPGMQGVMQLDTGTTSAGFCVAFGTGINGTIGGGTLQLGDGSLECTWFFKTDNTLSNGIDRYNFYLGLSDNVPTGSNSVFMFYRDNANGGAPVLFSTVGGVQQAGVNGSTVLTASTKYHVRLVISSTVKMYLATYGGTENLEATYSGSLPASSSGLGPWAFHQKTLGTTNRSLFLDGWQYNYTFTNQR